MDARMVLDAGEVRVRYEWGAHMVSDKDIKKTVSETKVTLKPKDPFIRAENEDDDGYDPYSDRRPEREPLFERDPWD